MTVNRKQESSLAIQTLGMLKQLNFREFSFRHRLLTLFTENTQYGHW